MNMTFTRPLYLCSQGTQQLPAGENTAFALEHSERKQTADSRYGELLGGILEKAKLEQISMSCSNVGVRRPAYQHKAYLLP
jgi:hypothetical protein